MWTLTVPRSGLDLRLLLLEHLGLARTACRRGRPGPGALSSSVARFAIALPETSRDAHAERERVDERADDDVAALLGLRRVDVVDVQRVVVHRDQAEQVVVGLGDRLRGPVLVDGADLELLEVAAVGVGAGGLARGLVGLDIRCRVVWSSWLMRDRIAGTRRSTHRLASQYSVSDPCATPVTSSSRSPSAPPSRSREIPFPPSRMIHFFDFSQREDGRRRCPTSRRRRTSCSATSRTRSRSTTRRPRATGLVKVGKRDRPRRHAAVDARQRARVARGCSTTSRGSSPRSATSST